MCVHILLYCFGTCANMIYPCSFVFWKGIWGWSKRYLNVHMVVHSKVVVMVVMVVLELPGIIINIIIIIIIIIIINSSSSSSSTTTTTPPPPPPLPQYRYHCHSHCHYQYCCCCCCCSCCYYVFFFFLFFLNNNNNYYYYYHYLFLLLLLLLATYDLLLSVPVPRPLLPTPPPPTLNQAPTPTLTTASSIATSTTPNLTVTNGARDLDCSDSNLFGFPNPLLDLLWSIRVNYWDPENVVPSEQSKSIFAIRAFRVAVRVQNHTAPKSRHPKLVLGLMNCLEYLDCSDCCKKNSGYWMKMPLELQCFHSEFRHMFKPLKHYRTLHLAGLIPSMQGFWKAELLV